MLIDDVNERIKTEGLDAKWHGSIFGKTNLQVRHLFEVEMLIAKIESLIEE
jgi:hypothetical protein